MGAVVDASMVLVLHAAVPRSFRKTSHLRHALRRMGTPRLPVLALRALVAVLALAVVG